MNLQEFYEGYSLDAYTYLGAHFHDTHVTFTTFAPHAYKVSLIGEFSDWEEIKMHPTFNGQFFSCSIDYARKGDMYKYRIYSDETTYVDHIDPFAFYAEMRPGNASRLYPLNHYQFKHNYHNNHECINIYEVHLGSFKKRGYYWYTYKEMVDVLIPYLKENDYNYVEIMPIQEHPADESWGYQGTGYFAPTSRYGTPDDFKYFIDQCHLENIGVILDYVPVHFAVDGFALNHYDGTPLYEYGGQRNEWGSCNFNFKKGHVRSFLSSAAAYWFDIFNVDGLRYDAVGNLIYYNGDSNQGENGDAIHFLKVLNKELKNRYPDKLLIAEDSTSYPNVTTPVDYGGLGFDYKWDLGWMNDTLSYMSSDPSLRVQDYHKLTFSMYYFYNEHYLLPFSHDEVVHLKKTILDKMYGSYDDKFKQARLLYLYMYTHPGKKLNFMGNEIGQFREWDEKRSQDWELLEYPSHRSFYHYMKHLKSLYQNHPSLYQLDYDQNGFEWVDCHQEEKCLYVYKRKGYEETTIIFLNFSKEDHEYIYKPHHKQLLVPLVHTMESQYGGTIDSVDTIDLDYEGKIIIPALSGIMFKIKE